MRMRIAAIATSVAALAAPVAAQGSPTSVVPRHQPAYEKHYRELRKQVVKHVGLNAAGRDIVSDGFREKNGDVHRATKAEVVASSDRMEASLNPPAPAPTSTTDTATTDTTTATTTSSTSSSTVQCESGGNYSTDTGNGFYGAYQFTQQTWESVGGSGNPADASPAEQDARAAQLYAESGSSPWPVCGQ